MFKMSIIRNSVGAGMVTMMAAMSALGGAAYLVSEMMISNEKVLKKDASVEAYKQLVELVRKNLYSGNNCTAAIGKTATHGGSNIASSMISGGQTVLTLPMNFGTNDLILHGSSDSIPGWRSKTGTAIKAIHMEINSVVRSNVRIHGDPVPKSAGYATLYIEPDHRGINIFKKDKDTGKYIYDNFHIKLFVYFQDNGGGNVELLSCYDPASDATFCTISLGGAFNNDPSIPAASRCQPDQQCFAYKSGVMSAGEACPAPFAATQVGAGFQMCNWCHPDPLPPDSAVGSFFSATNELDLDLENDDGESVNCDSSGYTIDGQQISEAEQADIFNQYGGNVALLQGQATGANAECLNYKPPEDGVLGSSDTFMKLKLKEELTKLSAKQLANAKTYGWVGKINGVKYRFTATQVNEALALEDTEKSWGDQAVPKSITDIQNYETLLQFVSIKDQTSLEMWLQNGIYIDLGMYGGVIFNWSKEQVKLAYDFVNGKTQTEEPQTPEPTPEVPKECGLKLSLAQKLKGCWIDQDSCSIECDDFGDCGIKGYKLKQYESCK